MVNKDKEVDDQVSNVSDNGKYRDTTECTQQSP